MKRSYVPLLSLVFFCALAVAPSAAEQEQPMHNEYHNSTVYYGSSPQRQEYYDDSYYGIHTYVDPENGDRVTSVRSRPSVPSSNQQPIVIEPIIRP